jgi:hypothetical protein
MGKGAPATALVAGWDRRLDLPAQASPTSAVTRSRTASKLSLCSSGSLLPTPTVPGLPSSYSPPHLAGMSSGDIAPAAAKPAKLQPPAYRFQKKVGGVMASRSALPKPARADSPAPMTSPAPFYADASGTSLPSSLPIPAVPLTGCCSMPCAEMELLLSTPLELHHAGMSSGPSLLR